MKESFLRERLMLACCWLTDIAQVRNEELYPAEKRTHRHETWSGAIRGEYNVAKREWGFFCPVWHTGQAVKALVMAAPYAGDFALEGAVAGGDFILKNVVGDGPDKGLILAYEDDNDKVNTSAILEGLDGLFELSAVTGNTAYREAALNALDWVSRRAYLADGGYFLDCYNHVKGEFLPSRYGTAGRPLLDDAVFLKGYRLNNNPKFKEIAVATAERLLREEEPVGNWINYAPCNAVRGNIHPRHAYWWGYPMAEIFKETGDEKFRDAFLRTVEWYRKAMRYDGGMFRGTYRDFNTDSWGHATSGTGCAVIMFIEAMKITGSDELLPYIEKGLDFCCKMQFTNPQDVYLKGVILEKLLPITDGWGRDGTDASPYYIRDLGTIFFIQAAAKYLNAYI